MNHATNMETILKRDRWFVLASLAGAIALAWAYLVVMASNMDVMALPAVEPWNALDFWLMLIMWAVMMIGMMLPSAAPMILLYAMVSRKQRRRGHVFAPTGVFAAGYAVAWTGFSLAATVLQWALEQAALLSPMMVSTSPFLGGALLIAAGTPRPGHLRHVDETFHPLFQLDEGAIIGDTDHPSIDAGSGGKFGVDILPGVVGNLLVAKTHPLPLPVELQDHHLHRVADLEHLGRMPHPAPGHVGDVKETVQSAEIDEGPVVGDVLDHTLDHLSLFQGLQGFRLQRRPLFFQQHAARENDVPPVPVQLDDSHLERLAEILIQVPSGTKVHLKLSNRLYLILELDF